MEKKNRDIIVAARFSRSDAALIAKVCELRGEQKSNFIRRAIRRELGRLSFLSTEGKKALELNEG